MLPLARQLPHHQETDRSYFVSLLYTIVLFCLTCVLAVSLTIPEFTQCKC